MKIDRLIGIITTLQQKGRVTAPYLAEKFEVSRRTINRDIEDICRAGIPLVTVQGSGGGIEIMHGFNIDTTVFTEDELQAVFAGLGSLDSVSENPVHKNLKDKIGASDLFSENIIIDLSSFHKESLSQKIGMFRKAVQEQKCMTFHYYYNKGEEDKLIEPALIVFKWSSWYVFGFCPDRNDFRMYKLTRLWDLKITDISFEPKKIPREKLDFGSHMTDDIKISAIYESSVKYKLVEEYGPYSFTVREGGKLFSELGFTSYEEAMEWFLKFGSKVRILAPDEFKIYFQQELKKMIRIYE